MCVDVDVCMCVHSIVAILFNLHLLNFSMIFIMWLSKKDFLKLFKKKIVSIVIAFFYISLKFLCEFEEQFRKNQRR